MGFRCGFVIEMKGLRIVFVGELQHFFAGDLVMTKALASANLDIFVVNQPILPAIHRVGRISIQTAIAIIARFSLNEINPSGTSPLPPTQAHLMSRFCTYTA